MLRTNRSNLNQSNGLNERDRRKPRKRISQKRGLPPGSLVHIGETVTPDVRIRVLTYNSTEYKEFDVDNVADLKNLPDSGLNVWVMVNGLHKVDVIEGIGKAFDLHPLVLEDVLNTTQRPKIEEVEDYTFVVLKMLHYEENTGEIEPEQVSIILGKNRLITFQESERDDFDVVRERITSGKGRLRKEGPDYLCYTLIDFIVDNYFIILEKVAEKIELLEEELVRNPTVNILHAIHELKTELIFLRRSIWPLREVIGRLSVADWPMISPSTRPFLRDVYDHIIHISETLETYRELVSDLLDLYLSSVSYKLNEIMKVLTIIATIFIPLTFLSGWYGMNFKYMPELEWRWGYPMVMVMASMVAGSMMIFFRRRKWI
jgi:magnesium transporter